jgi:hypothetical protein
MGLQTPPPSLPKPAVDSSQTERPFLRPFLARGGLRFPVSVRRYRLQVAFGAPVSGGENPVPNSNRVGGLQECARPAAKADPVSRCRWRRAARAPCCTPPRGWMVFKNTRPCAPRHSRRRRLIHRPQRGLSRDLRSDRPPPRGRSRAAAGRR